MGSIVDGFIGIFFGLNPSGRTMALRSTPPVTKLSNRNVFWVKRRSGRKADNFANFMYRLSRNSGRLKLLQL